MNWEGYEVEGQMDISEFLDKGENMTENEIKEFVKKLRNKAELFKNSGFAVGGIVKSFEDSANAIETLSEEIQQYRVIGTVEEFKALKENEHNCKDCAGCTNWKCDCFNERTYAIDKFVSALVPRLTDAIYPKDVESMTNLINGVAEELKAGVDDED